MKIIERTDELFPRKLLQVKPKIERIYVEGDETILNNFGLAVIGSRNSSKEGEKLTDEFVSRLVKNNINIISGMAIGIDSKAHRACMTNGGKTIAIIGSGFDNIYPKENIGLFQKIIETGGAVISEYPPEAEVATENFPRRNRIVSGLSDGVLVIEGKYRSGTTITAKYAFEQKKPVFCMPHSVFNSYGTGPNWLIQKGGILVTNQQDIIDYYQSKGIEFQTVQNKRKYYDDEILQLLSEEILTKEELTEKLNKTISEINQRLTMLELDGIISEEYRERV